MRKLVSAAGIVALIATSPAFAQIGSKASSGKQMQTKGEMSIPRCQRRIGSLAIVEPDNQWWREFNLGSPEAILRVFVQQSGCFTLVNRGRSMQSRAMERAMADNGELQSGSNLGKGQVKAADYFLEPNIVTANRNSGGGGAGAVLGGLGGLFGGAGRVFGAVAGSINVKKGEANVTLSIVNARTTEEQALTQGYARKSDVSFGAAGGGGTWGLFGGAAGGGYQDTAIGQIIVLAYLDAYTKLVGEMGGLPTNAAAAAPQATNDEPAQSPRASMQPAAATSSGLGLTLAGYNAMKMGMSYPQVVKLLGVEGTEQGASPLGTQYVWQSGGRFLVVTFTSSGKMSSKSKAGF